MKKSAQRARLNQVARDIEFLLISVIQGVALGALASNAAEPIGNIQWEYCLYVVSGFLFILNFWSQAIIHTVSFIDWPLDLTHNFLYFLVSFIEVMAFAHLTDPLRWFVFISAFFVAATVLYIFDVHLIKKRKEKFEDSQARKQLYKHILTREQFELKIFLPYALAFNFFATLAIIFSPQIFLTNHYHIILICLQALFGFVFLINSAGNFRKRSELITNII